MEPGNQANDGDPAGAQAPRRLTHGQLALALRIGGVDAGTERGEVGAPANAADGWAPHPGEGMGAPAPARRAAALITVGILCAGGLVAGSITADPRNDAESGRHEPSGSRAIGSIRGAGSVPGPIQEADTRQGQQTMFSKLSGVAAATAVGVSTTIAGAQGAAVQWKVSDGGNGHWYELRELPNRPTCAQAAAMAQASGARLVALEDASENNFFKNLRCSQAKQHLSGWQDLSRVGGLWVWGSGESFEYQSWSPGQPDGGGTATIDWSGPNGQCDSLTWGDEGCETGNLPSSLFLEWSADCNNDGIVDYGQILDGTMEDANSNGIPDVCEITCSDADLYRNGLVDGADLGILLSEWGPATASTTSDLDGDGTVGGGDLGLMLSYWGNCAG
jgi:hypothetical protein